MSISKLVPSSSTNGKPIKIAATATAGTGFHTTGSGTTVLDEIYMYLSNSDTVDKKVTVEFGGVTSPDNLLYFTVPAKETILAIAGIPLCNSLSVAAFCETANVVTMSGYVNRIS